MASINYATREISCKIVYYGPGLSGKTTNLQIIHRKIPDKDKSEMVSLATETDRTLFFDFLPLDLGSIKGFSTKFQLYTVPGQVYYNATRKLVLRGVDGVVFVVDSQIDKLQENLESFANLQENLREYGHSIENIPLVLQYNKRDLPNVYPVEQLNALLNKLNLPHYEAVAATGVGVFTTLKGIGKSVIDKFNAKYAGFQGTRRPIRPGESATITQPIQPKQHVAPPQPPQPQRPAAPPSFAGGFGGPANSNFPPPGSFGAPASPAPGGFNNPPPAFNAPTPGSFAGPISSGFTPATNPFAGNTNFPSAPKPAPVNPAPMAPPSFPSAGAPVSGGFPASSATNPFGGASFNSPPFGSTPLNGAGANPAGQSPFAPPAAGGIPISSYVEGFGSQKPAFSPPPFGANPVPNATPPGMPGVSPFSNQARPFPNMPSSTPSQPGNAFPAANAANPFGQPNAAQYPSQGAQPPAGAAFPPLNKTQGPFPTLAMPIASNPFEANNSLASQQGNTDDTGNEDDTGNMGNYIGPLGSAGNPGNAMDRSGIVSTYENLGKDDSFKTKKLPHPTEKKKGFFDGLFKRDK